MVLYKKKINNFVASVVKYKHKKTKKKILKISKNPKKLIIYKKKKEIFIYPLCIEELSQVLYVTGK